MYQISCSTYEASYIGESSRRLEKRQAEHKSKTDGNKSAVQEHVHRSKNSHKIDWENVKLLEKETRDFPRKVLWGNSYQEERTKFEPRHWTRNTVWDNLLRPNKIRGSNVEAIPPFYSYTPIRPGHYCGVPAAKL